jgi:hypothetical protein
MGSLLGVGLRWGGGRAEGRGGDPATPPRSPQARALPRHSPWQKTFSKTLVKRKARVTHLRDPPIPEDAPGAGGDTSPEKALAQPPSPRPATQDPYPRTCTLGHRGTTPGCEDDSLGDPVLHPSSPRPHGDSEDRGL